MTSKNNAIHIYWATFENPRCTRMETIRAKTEAEARKIAKELAKNYEARLTELRFIK